jgi:hypothetical protein
VILVGLGQRQREGEKPLSDGIHGV